MVCKRRGGIIVSGYCIKKVGFRVKKGCLLKSAIVGGKCSAASHYIFP